MIDRSRKIIEKYVGGRWITHVDGMKTLRRGDTIRMRESEHADLIRDSGYSAFVTVSEPQCDEYGSWSVELQPVHTA